MAVVFDQSTDASKQPSAYCHATLRRNELGSVTSFDTKMHVKRQYSFRATYKDISKGKPWYRA